MRNCTIVSSIIALSVFSAAANDSAWVRPDLLAGHAPITSAKLQHRIPADRQRIAALVDKVADQTGVRREVMHHHVRRESSYNPSARNPKSTATGLGQIIHGTHEAIVGRRMTRGEHFALAKNPEHNLRLTAAHIKACEWAMPGADADRLYRCHYNGHRAYGSSLQIASAFYRSGAWANWSM